MIILVLLIILIAVFVAFIVCKWMSLKAYNQKPLEIKTFDRLDSPYHPSVLYFSEGWNGWKYWMAETPFSPKCTPYRDRNECPSIHVSNDGVRWTEIANNPISDLSEKEVRELDYFSDPHLVKKDGMVECFFRHTRRHGKVDDFSDVTILKSVSGDGLQWSDPKIVLKPAFPVVSPAMTYEEERYRMWYVDSEDHHQSRNICMIHSDDGNNWSEPTTCELHGHNINPWHIDIQKVDGYLYLTVYDFNNITLWCSGIDKPTKFEYVQTIFRPAAKKYGSFYSNGLYRACMTESDRGLELYFSADDSKQTFIGRMVCPKERIDHTGPMRFEFATEKGKHSNFGEFIKATTHGYKRWGCFVIKNLCRRISR